MRPSAAALVPLILLASCIADADYPSLAPRAVERDLADDEASPAAQAPVVAEDPALAARVLALLAEARQGQAAFEAAFAAARSAVARAGAPASDSWIEAQQAVSRAEAARAATVQALAELDALGVAAAQAGAVNAADIQRIASATAEAQALAERQRGQLSGLQARLSPS